MNVSHETILLLDYLYECYKNYMAMVIRESCGYLYYSEDGGTLCRAYIDHTTGKAMNRLAIEMLLRGEY